MEFFLMQGTKKPHKCGFKVLKYAMQNHWILYMASHKFHQNIIEYLFAITASGTLVRAVRNVEKPVFVRFSI